MSRANLDRRAARESAVKVAVGGVHGSGGGNGELAGSLDKLTGNMAIGGIDGVGYRKNKATAPIAVPNNQQTKEEDAQAEDLDEVDDLDVIRTEDEHGGTVTT